MRTSRCASPASSRTGHHRLAGRSRDLMTRTSERTTVTSEAVPGVALTLSADRGYHGTALSQITKALKLRIPSRRTSDSLVPFSCMAASWRSPSDRHGGDLRADAVELGVVGDALEVVAGCVGGGERGGLVVGQLDVERGYGVVDLSGRARADQRGGHHGVPAQPGERDLGAGDATRRGGFADRVDDRVVAVGGQARVEEVGERIRGGPGRGGGVPRPGEAAAGE